MIGGKARGLQILERAGFRVPEYFVIQADEFSQNGDLLNLKHLESWLHSHTIDAFAVRSSSEAEDSAKASWAGIFDSHLGVKRSDLKAAIGNVWQSRHNAKRFGPAEIQMAVIVQRMVSAQRAGVAFSRAPMGSSADVLIETAEGLGTGVVDGFAPTQTVRVDRFNRLVSSDGPDILTSTEIKNLAELILRAEHRLGFPVDLEWAIDAEGIWLLQARPITTEINDILWLTDFNLAESYSGYTAPLSCDFIRLMYKNVFADCAKFLGAGNKRLASLLPYYETMIEEIDGHLYYNMQSYAAALLPLPNGQKAFRDWKQMVGVPIETEIPMPTVAPPSIDEIISATASVLRFGVFQRKSMSRFIVRAGDRLDRLEKEKREIHREPKAILRRILNEFDHPQDLALGIFNDYFVMKGGSQTPVDGLPLESIKPQRALAELRALLLPEDAAIIRTAARSESEQPAVVLSRLTNIDWKNRLLEFLRLYGSRCFGDLKLETQTFRQNIAPLCRLILAAAPDKTDYRGSGRHRSTRFGRSVGYREACRLLRTRYFAWVREMFLLFSAELKALAPDWKESDIFFLRLSSLRRFLESEISIEELVATVERQTRPHLDFPHLVAIDARDRHLPTVSPPLRSPDQLRGSLVSGSLEKGRILVVEDPFRIPDDMDLSEFYLVTPTTDPAWVYLLSRCRGIISERGNSLSHLAIIARELKKTMVVQVDGACRMLASNQEIVLHADGTSALIEIR